MQETGLIPKNLPLLVMVAAIGISMFTGSWSADAQGNRINSREITRPAGTQPFAGDSARLLASGVERHGDARLSPQGRSCNTCHAREDSYNATFKKPWPHFIASVKQKAGLDRITAEGMVQFCMISAMGTKPLPWDSEALAALTTFVLERHRKVVEK